MGFSELYKLSKITFFFFFQNFAISLKLEQFFFSKLDQLWKEHSYSELGQFSIFLIFSQHRGLFTINHPIRCITSFLQSIKRFQIILNWSNNRFHSKNTIVRRQVIKFKISIFYQHVDWCRPYLTISPIHLYRLPLNGTHSWYCAYAVRPHGRQVPRSTTAIRRI